MNRRGLEPESGAPLARRIAHLLEYPTLSGGERSLLTLLERMDRDRFESFVLAPEVGRLPFALREIDVRHVPFEVHRDGGPPPPRPVLASRIARVLRREGADLLHANSLSMSCVSGRAAAEAGIVSVGHVRDILRLSRSRVADLSLNRSLVCVSRATADNLVDQGVSPDRVRSIPNAVDPQVFRPDGPRAGIREELMIPEDAPLVGSIGQICLRKAQDVLVRALAYVVEKVPDAVLLVVGERMSGKKESLLFEEKLHRFVERRKLEGNVRFLGYRDDVPALLRDLDVLAHAAHQEPLGRVLLEAAASGVPAVATIVGGTEEVVVHGETGLLVPPGRPGPLARGISNLLRNEDRRRTLGQAARERALERFSPRDHAARMADVFEAALAHG